MTTYLVVRKNSNEGEYIVERERNHARGWSKADIAFASRSLKTAEEAAELCNRAEREHWTETDLQCELQGIL
jgi:hypothetical protein